MQFTGIKGNHDTLAAIGLAEIGVAHWNLSPAELVEETLLDGEGTLTDTGALAIDTGEFTGRSPKDKRHLFHVFESQSGDCGKAFWQSPERIRK
jgi:ATP-dependent phosphoenolpyruvate carboxykinase